MRSVAPLTDREVDGVLCDLRDAAAKRPEIVSNPTFLGMFRLAVTVKTRRGAPGASPVRVALPLPPAILNVAPPADDGALRATAENEALRAQIAELESTSRAQEGRQAREAEALRQTITERGHEIARLIAAGTETARLLEGVRGSLAAATADATSKKVSYEHEQGEFAKYRAKWSNLLPLAAALEYCGKSPKFTSQKTGHPLACCPFCLGLNPEGLKKNDKDVGHRPTCALGDFLTRFRAAAK